MNIEEAIDFLGTKGYTVVNRANYQFFVTGEGLGELYPELSMDKDRPESYLHNTINLNADQFSAFVSEFSGGEPVVAVEALTGAEARAQEEELYGGSRYDVDSDAVGAGNGGLQGPPPTYPPNLPWPPQLMAPIRGDFGEIIGYEPVPGTVDWDAYSAILREERLRLQGIEEPSEGWLGTEEVGDWIYEVYGYTDATGEHITRKVPRATKDPRQSLDNLIALALGEVDDWSATEGADYDNLQRARALFDFKNQPTDAERLRMAMDIAQSPSDYMTLVAMYTGAISRESGPARVGEKVAPLMPYLQQMAQKFFLDIPGINEMPAPGAEAAETIDGEAATMADGADVGALGATPQKTLEELQEEYRQEYGEVELTDEPLEHWEVGPSSITAPKTLEELQEEYRQEYGGVELTDEPLEHWEFPPSPITPPMTFGEELKRPGGELFSVGDLGGTRQKTLEELQEEHRQQYGGVKLTEVPDEMEYGGDFQQGGIVPGKMGEPKLIRAEGGEIVIPNAVRSPYTESLFGPTFTPRRETLGRFLTRPAKVQIPSMIGGDFRFRSPQTIRRMTPLQRSLFQEGIKSFGVPWGDFRMQESLATGVGGSGRPRAQFRRPSFVRG